MSFYLLKNLKNESVTLLCTNFLNSLEEKITAHSGLTYLIRFTKHSGINIAVEKNSVLTIKNNKISDTEYGIYSGDDCPSENFEVTIIENNFDVIKEAIHFYDKCEIIEKGNKIKTAANK